MDAVILISNDIYKWKLQFFDSLISELFDIYTVLARQDCAWVGEV